MKQAEEKLSRSFPEGISAFLRVTNGLSLFSTSLELYGIRFSVDRSLTADPQPFSILTANVHERPRRAKDSQFVFGSYGWDGSTLIFEETTGSVERWERGSEDTLNRWPSLKNMLEQEVARLSTQFSSDGILLHEDVPTTPPKMSRKIGSGANEFH